MKKGLIYAGLILATCIATTAFQPLAYLGTWAAPHRQAGCQTFKETGKTVCGRFLQYWQQNGGLPQQGYPISNEFREKSDLDGKDYTVQYFERAVFELHPENKPPYDVLLSQLGTFQFNRKYPNGEPGAPPPTPVPPPGVDAKVPLQREGVTVMLTADSQLTADCNGLMKWLFSVENASKGPFTVQLDEGSVAQTDSTGREYKPKPCYVFGDRDRAFLGAFQAPTTVVPGAKAIGEVRMDVINVPASAAYLDLKLTISGQALTFRYPLR